jgi:hypothetical protein
VLRVLARTDVSNERRTMCSVEAFTKVRRELAVHYDVNFGPGIGWKDRGARHQYGLRQNEDIRRHPAVPPSSAPPPDSASTAGCFAETRTTTERRALETAGSSAQMRASGMPGTTAAACSCCV